MSGNHVVSPVLIIAVEVKVLSVGFSNAIINVLPLNSRERRCAEVEHPDSKYLLLMYLTE